MIGAGPARAYISPMFADFLSKLIQPEPEQLDDADARLALTALLVRIARSDGFYDAKEVDHIERIAARPGPPGRTGQALRAGCLPSLEM